MSRSVSYDFYRSRCQTASSLCSPAAARKFVEEGIKTLEGKCKFGASVRTPVIFFSVKLPLLRRYRGSVRALGFEEGA